MRLRGISPEGDTFLLGLRSVIGYPGEGAHLVTDVKTAGYTASVGEIVRANAISGGFTVNLPAGCADGSEVFVKKLDSSSNVVTVQRSGSDTFNVANTGPSSLQLIVPGQTVCVRYSSGVWHVIGHSVPAASLDDRYFRRAGKLPDTNGNTALQFTAVSNARSWLNLYNAATDGVILLRGSGFDENVGLGLVSKGNQGVSLYGAATSVPAAMFMAASEPINFWQFSSSNSGSAVLCDARSSGGVDTDVDFNFRPRGAGKFKVNSVEVATVTGPTIDAITDSNGQYVVAFSGSASAANFVSLQNAAPGNPALVRGNSLTESNVDLSLVPKGTGAVSIQDSAFNVVASFLTTSTPVNRLIFKPGNTTLPVTISATGSDTNVSVSVEPKGAGRLQVSGVNVPTISSADAFANKDLSSGTNTFPTLNQNTTGSAATLTTPRKISGASFDGSADITTASTLLAPPQYVSGNYYLTTYSPTVTTTLLTNNRISVTPWVVSGSVSIDSLIAEMTVAGEAGSVFRFGIWNSDAYGQPSTLIAASEGTVATTGAAGCIELTYGSPITLANGLYWVGGAAQSAATTPPTMRTQTTSPWLLTLGATKPANLNTAHGGVFLSGISGSFTTFNYAGSFAGAGATRIGFKVS